MRFTMLWKYVCISHNVQGFVMTVIVGSPKMRGSQGLRQNDKGVIGYYEIPVRSVASLAVVRSTLDRPVFQDARSKGCRG